MKALTFQVTDELYEAFQQVAAKYGQTVEEVALQWLATRRPKPGPAVKLEAGEPTRQRFQRHFGTWESGDPDSANNERLDTDLEREYGNLHQQGA